MRRCCAHLGACCALLRGWGSHLLASRFCGGDGVSTFGSDRWFLAAFFFVVSGRLPRFGPSGARTEKASNNCIGCQRTGTEYFHIRSDCGEVSFRPGGTATGFRTVRVKVRKITVGCQLYRTSKEYSRVIVTVLRHSWFELRDARFGEDVFASFGCVSVFDVVGVHPQNFPIDGLMVSEVHACEKWFAGFGDLFGGFDQDAVERGEELTVGEFRVGRAGGQFDLADEKEVDEKCDEEDRRERIKEAEQ